MTFKVHIADPAPNGYDYNETFYNTMNTWAQEYCTSYIGFTVTDVADVSVFWDEIGEYEFTNEQDALAFTLKWKH